MALVAGLEMILDKAKIYGLLTALAAVTALLSVQTVRLQREQIAHRDLIAATVQAGQARTTAALRIEQRASALESTHAATTIGASDAFTTSQPVRDAIARTDLARVDRLRIGADQRAATYRAHAQASAAACGGLADRHAALDAHIVRGVGVVSGLRGDLDRRDAEVALLRGVIDADRALMGQGMD